jgi:hypothetical protein
MNATSDYTTLLRTIQKLPRQQRFSLVQEVLTTLAQEPEPKSRKRNTLGRALGLLQVEGKPAPTDAEVERWLDEHRAEKYL